MDYSTKNPDRAILESRKAVWVVDPERTLTEGELDLLLRYFGEIENGTEPELRPAINERFRSFMGRATKERFRESGGRLEKVPKPSTIVERQMQRLQNACEQLDGQLAQLDPVTRTWLGLCHINPGKPDKSTRSAITQ